jgi:DNA-binding CsgD family transcriptional regulator
MSKERIIDYINERLRSNNWSEVPNHLSEREAEYLFLMCQSFINKELAQDEKRIK